MSGPPKNMAQMIDPTVTGNYPVILGDGLLGKDSNEIFTGIRYNHKPALTSDARLKPSLPGKTSSYDLAFHDSKGTHTFTGTRTTENDDYVLYFDPQRKAFILDKVDSTFNMNITRLPGNGSAEDLRRQYPALEKPKPLRPEGKKVADKDKEKAKPSAPKSSTTTSTTTTSNKAASAPKARKIEKKQQQQSKKLDLALPTPMPQQPKPEPKAERKSSKQQDDDEEEDEDDDLLLVEYPGAENATRKTDFSPAFPVPRRFDDFMDQRESEADDADGESDEEPDMLLVNNPLHHGHGQSQMNGGHVDASDTMEIDEAELEAAFENAAQGETADLEDDLEKEMQLAFDDLQNSQGGSPDGDESEISEED